MKYIFVLCIIAGFLLFPTQAKADGNLLLVKCNSAIHFMDEGKILDNSVDAGLCLGLMQGITQSNVIANRAGHRGLICLPPNGLANGQAARIVVKFLKENPKRLNENETALAIDAFKTAYPCQTSSDDKPEAPKQGNVVQPCSFVARLAALTAKMYPNDEQKRTDSFKTIMESMLKDPLPNTPTIEQFSTAFVLMQALVATKSPDQTLESLNEVIISDAAATCAATSLAP